MNDEYYLLGTDTRCETYTFSAENPNGTKGGGSKGKPWEKLCPCAYIKPGEEYALVDTDGPGVVQSMWFGGHTGKEFIIRMYWDNMEEPAVEAPLCSFFGFGHNLVRDGEGDFPVLNSAMVLVAPCRGLNCYWQMPFLKHCRITLYNRSKQDLWSFYTVTLMKKQLPENIRYFCASYRESLPVPEGEEYVVIDGIKGQGHFAGMSLSTKIYRDGCWVEGEAKMFIDGDVYPTINYTGTEDYFGGSFGFGCDNGNFRYETYSGLYKGMFAVNGVDSNDERFDFHPRFMLYRWHIPDPIFFNEDFKMTLQDLPAYGDNFQSVAYWYQTMPIQPLKRLPLSI